MVLWVFFLTIVIVVWKENGTEPKRGRWMKGKRVAGMDQQPGTWRAQESDLHLFVGEAYREVTRRKTIPDIEAVFYPFVGLHHTIRVRQQRMLVRISDHLREAPAGIYQAIAHILVARLFRQPVAGEMLHRYRSYIYREEVQLRVEAARRLRGRKQETGAKGRVYHLEPLFEELNQRFFAGELCQPHLGWSLRPSWRTLGHYDQVLDTIVISCALDRPRVPRYVVEFVLYHEMLHLKYPVEVVQGRRCHHSAHFRQEERRFPMYEAAHEALLVLGREASRGAATERRPSRRTTERR